MFASSGPLLHFPTTPTSHSHHPLTSSPLSAVSPSPSPTAKVQARRRSQYKSTAPLPSSSSAPRRTSIAYNSNRRHSSPGDSTSFLRGNLFGPATEKKTDEETPRNVLIRERFRQRCFERAQRARESKIRKGRKFSASSDDGDMDMDDEDDGEVDAFLDDEIYRRIIMSTQRKREHTYRVSYQLDVGSSFDPDMEDPVEWEQDLREDEVPLPPLPGPLPPSEFDDDEAAELAALAEDEAYWDALDADDLAVLDELGEDSKAHHSRQARDDDMDMS